MSTATAAGTAEPSGSTQDPWERFGWMMWATWLVFLVFPLWSALSSERPGWVVAGVVLLVLAFAGVYAVELVRLTRGRVRTLGTLPEHVLGLVVLWVLALATAPVIGWDWLSFLPFLQSFGVFVLPRPGFGWYAATLMAGALVAVVALGDLSNLTFLLILLGVTAASLAGRLLGDHAEANEEAQRGRTVAEERERVARDVHDVLGHSLTVLSVKADLAQRLLDVDPARARDELADIARISRDALGEVRATVGGLRAARLEDEIAGARVALEGRGIVAVVPSDVQESDPRYRPVMGWVLREAVTNVVRHSGAGRCEVRLQRNALVVEDDGRGLGDGAEGNGLRGLRERVDESGGTLGVESRAGGGTRVEVRW